MKKFHGSIFIGDMINKIFIYSDRNLENLLKKNLTIKKRKFSSDLNKIKKAQEDALPLLFYLGDTEVVIINYLNDFINFHEKFKKHYPKSKYLINFSKSTPLYKNKKLLKSFSKHSEKKINRFLYTIPAEKFGVENKFEIYDFNSKDYCFFYNSADFLKFLNSF